MELVIDTNILFSYFWNESFSKKIIMNQNLKLYSPEFALQEINKYQEEIISKTKLTKKEFDEIKKEIAISVIFISIKEYKEKLNQAMLFSPDKNDIDFFTVCLKLNLALWSNDNILKKQSNVPVFSTQDLFDKFYDILFFDVE